MKKKQTRRDFIKAGALTGSLFFLPKAVAGLSGITGATAAPPLLPDALLEEMGLVDVTSAPYLADPTGTRDSTRAIQDAVNDARDKRMVCFFPEGTYLISETISCEQRVVKQDQPRYLEYNRMSYWNIREPIFMLGSTRGPRPVIKLAPNARGFDDPSRPKLAIKIWAQTWGDFPGQNEPIFGWEQPNISFGHIFKGIDIDLGGHAGAIGLRHTGSQGSYLMDSAVNAEGAYAGFNNCPGQGGGTYNIEVRGGRYGLLADPACRFPMLAGCSFRGQTVAPVAYSSYSVPMLLVGCMLESNGPAAVDLSQIDRFTGISLIDCIIRMNAPGVIVQQDSSQNIFLENVYVKGADLIQTNGQKIPDPKKWTYISRLSACSDFAENLINGVKSKETFVEWKPVKSAPAEAEIRSRHWRRLPSFEDEDAVNVKSMGAVGDGETDDTEAIRKALQKGRKIFFPPGRFRVTEALELPPHTELFGLHGASLSAPSVTTHDDPEDTTLVSFLSINGNLEWRSGKGVIAFGGGRMQISGNGGGRFYAMRGIGGGGRGEEADESLFKDTKQMISLYTLNIERRRTNPQASIKNAEHVRIYFLKCEASETGYVGNAAQVGSGNTPLAIIDCKDVKLYCVNGNVRTSYQRPMVDVVNSRNVMVSQAASFNTGNFPQIRETFGDQSFEIPSDRVAALFIRD